MEASSAVLEGGAASGGVKVSVLGVGIGISCITVVVSGSDSWSASGGLESRLAKNTNSIGGSGSASCVSIIETVCLGNCC